MTDPYAFGTRSAETRALQTALAHLGLYAGAVDGIFGTNTRAALGAARQKFGLGAGGVDDPLLLALGLKTPPQTLATTLQSLLAGWATAHLPTLLKGLLPMDFLSGYRTYIVAGVMLLTGIAGLVGADIPSVTGQAPGNLVMEALAFFFLRQGLKTDITKS
jgi:peptidoglycan hydrolase-like protein with peptidoglycan-binding domain